MSMDCSSVSVYVTTLLRTGTGDSSSRINAGPVAYSQFRLVSNIIKCVFLFHHKFDSRIFFTFFDGFCSNKFIFLTTFHFNFNSIYASLVLILLFTHKD